MITDPVKLAIVYYSATGTGTEIAQELRDAGIKAGAEVRLLRAAELAPQSAINSNPAWAANHAARRTSRRRPRRTSSGRTPWCSAPPPASGTSPRS